MLFPGFSISCIVIFKEYSNSGECPTTASVLGVTSAPDCKEVKKKIKIETKGSKREARRFFIFPV